MARLELTEPIEAHVHIPSQREEVADFEIELAALRLKADSFPLPENAAVEGPCTWAIENCGACVDTQRLR
jgi:hypothetical protein